MVKFVASTLLISASLLSANALWMPTKAWLSERLIHFSWQHYQQTGDWIKPWPWADTYPLAAMTFSRLDKSIVVLNGGDETTLAFSAGAIAPFNQANSTLPFVVAGHSDSHFSFLSEVVMEDVISLTDSNGRNQLYIVKAIEVVDSAEEPELQLGDENLVLITCYPFNGVQADSKLRYIIKAQLLS